VDREAPGKAVTCSFVVVVACAGTDQIAWCRAADWSKESQPPLLGLIYSDRKTGLFSDRHGG
jgi:hypothetical protein